MFEVGSKCTGHYHSEKFNNMAFVCCTRCKNFDKSGKPAPALHLWIGVCPEFKERTQ